MGFCKNRTQCWNLHAEHFCKIFLNGGTCFEKDCSSRHPITADIIDRGFKPGNECVYLHQKENDCPVENEIVSDKYIHENNENMVIDKNVDISEN